MPGFHSPPVEDVVSSGVDGPVVEFGPVSAEINSEKFQIFSSYITRTWNIYFNS